MNIKIVTMISILTAACSSAFANEKTTTTCAEKQLFINSSNYMILTKMPPMMPGEKSLSVHFSGKGKLYRYESSGTMSLSHCGQLESRAETEERDIGNNKTMRSTTTVIRDKQKGWLTEMRIDGFYPNKASIDSRHYYTDELGRIVRAEGQYKMDDKLLETTTWEYLYDDQNRLIREVIKPTGSPAAIIVDYYHDINGRLAHVTEESRSRLLRWDGQGRWLSSLLLGLTAENRSRFEEKCVRWDVVGNCTQENRWEADTARAGADREIEVNYQIEYQPNHSQ
ncbi:MULTISPECIES: hypothetical protein [Klebsiella]|nr:MULTISPECIES: hypothetical protein [Klebsiella]NRE87105.1 hypothetical protein [Klebsiella michiganensis]AYZ15507.1 hypothetical protein EGY08_01785 [Klebsiella sp. FDAARGOS_511]MBZ7660889.1 hypothetical protein [Klebsiella grimontii]MDM4220968.1 hypothetical protein [Klebsiella pasteurii]MDV1907198.1 hypothetical protein [Klebsiella pasteurii]